jgi:hypothetical protein
MTRKKISQANQNRKTKRTGNPIPWRYCVLTLLCGFFLISGFFFAARQHFSSIDLSIKNSRLRRQLDELEADKRRLILAKEIALSPAEIKKVAKKIGFTEASDKIAAAPAAINTAVKQKVVKAKQEILSKIEDAKKAVAAPIKEAAAKIERPREVKEKPEKSVTQNSAK